MTPRERWQAVLSGHQPDRMPMDYWGTPEASGKLMRHLGCATWWEVVEQLHIDQIVGVTPRYVGPPLPPQTDIYGRRHAAVDYGTGAYEECVNTMLAGFASVEEIEANYTWPTADWFDYRRAAGTARGQGSLPGTRGRFRAVPDLLRSARP